MPNRPDISIIRKYLNGELDEKAMHQLEREAQNDPALFDIIEGMEMGDPLKDDVVLMKLNSLIGERASQKDKTRKFSPWKIWSVAASLLLICTLGVLLQRRSPVETAHIAQQSKPATEPQQHTDPLLPEAEIKAKLSENKDIIASVIHRRANRTPAIKVQLNNAEKVAGAPTADKAGMSGIALTKMDSGMQSSQSLNEIVIVGYAAQQKKAVTGSESRIDSANIPAALTGRASGVVVESARQSSIRIKGRNSIEVAEPVTGWKAYQKYLDKKAKKIDGVSGAVTLTFNLDQDGKPTEVIILTGLTDVVNQKATEILIKGSKWIRPTAADGRITLVIQFH